MIITQKANFILKCITNKSSCMKRIIIILGFFICISGYSQQQESYSLFFSIGYKYTPLEYLGGPSFGLSLYNLDRRISINLRNDIIFSIGKNYNFSGMSDLEFYGITDYHTYNYLDIDYGFKNEKVIVSCGLGWIYTGRNENIKLNSDYGYLTSTVSVQYKYKWLIAELRGDIPLIKYEKHLNQINHGLLFPVSIAFIYKFSPKVCY